MSPDLLDKIRSANAFLSAVGFTLMVMEVHGLWKYISRARKMRYISISIFAFAVCYGSLEAAYWPEHNLRVIWTSVAVISMVAAGVCGNLERSAREKQRRD